MTTSIRMQFDFNTGGLIDVPEVIRDQDCTINTPVTLVPALSLFMEQVSILYQE